tara:strand:+ start:22805 stop:24769 length:1965 start_codon:yes stop_codon:yes gene_type:complete
MRSFFFLITAFLFSYTSYSQPGIVHEFGKPSQNEIDMEFYDKDADASAIYLYEKGNLYFQIKEDRVWIINEYYAKIKVFNVAKFDASIEIPYYTSTTFGERVEDLEAQTINDNTIYKVNPDEIFTQHDYGRWHSRVFSFNNVKDGSILEYRYTIASPYHLSFDDWQFQGSLPKIYSEFSASIPFNYVYRKFLIGEKKLDKEVSVIKKRCLVSDVLFINADCEYLEFAMKDIPAFEQEDYMLSKKNYISRIVFKIQEYTNYFGRKIVYFKPWDKLDVDYNKNNIIQQELDHKNFFKNKVPEEIRKIENNLEKAKQVFAFFQNYYTWNKNYFSIDDTIELKDAFGEKSGSVSEINLALLNSLLGLGYESYVILLSTRNNGLPNQIYTSFLEFDYLIVKVIIDNQVYLLDATDKFTSFGVLPLRCLNHFGRLMNYKGKSKWFDISTASLSVKQINVIATIDSMGLMKGVVKERNSIHFNRLIRSKLDNFDEVEYKKSKEKEYKNSSIKGLKTNRNTSNEEPIIEEFEFEFPIEKQDNLYFLNPFLKSFFSENPFKLKIRNYPINFGYKQNFIYQISLKIDPSFKLPKLPENKTFRIGDRTAELKYLITENSNQIDLRLTFIIDREEFASEQYNGIKDLFNELVLIQNNSQLILEKEY